MKVFFVFKYAHDFVCCYSKKMISCAGVVCSALHEGTTYILLGQERDIKGWNGSLKWSGFSGRILRSENEIDGAIRELNEETMALISTTGLELSSCKKSIKESRGTTLFRHVLFFYHIEYDTSLPEKFKELRKKLLYIDHIFNKLKRLKYFHNLPGILTPGHFISNNLIISKVVIVTQQIVEIYLMNIRTLEIETYTIRVDKAHIKKIDSLHKAIRKMNSDLDKINSLAVLNHPCVHLVKYENQILNGWIDKSFLEKVELRLFSCNELMNILNTRSYLLRKTFAEHLHNILVQIN